VARRAGGCLWSCLWGFCFLFFWIFFFSFFLSLWLFRLPPWTVPRSRLAEKESEGPDGPRFRRRNSPRTSSSVDCLLPINSAPSSGPGCEKTLGGTASFGAGCGGGGGDDDLINRHLLAARARRAWKKRMGTAEVGEVFGDGSGGGSRGITTDQFRVGVVSTIYFLPAVARHEDD